ncbi:FAST kinase domain-containing protein 5, mitochondrial isoform X1 [Carcharodon carcharias]|uniref:FAST kinase domain-containing protein 5, mitochondrial isoform X1 n=1 Tax=Carcharodon carcharias TaxID=13397 RepID=UPI001B7ECDC6|nr:FAST kinase domain-containing protein 5, mitochondrial isoform X1 [Carcharodon carcharias]XP_041046785.1 FAST kinase domain-containing protein 5, mitochondrial isoform X1 [Carcharodon carcharias]XP_041046792.1 FAST kinase domain-containing protein 5, mitochondrial isoform X1 [Carcharodon carcharias]XP_041046801.1 FAST kinase domain-containing protein 5, mitochondrial isoform X1 [Carcharodon carcharias]XP_041046811.1 FAST kinase domain-containing protein 5, mitochondrial isoform X1 [Carcharod
MNMAAVIWRKLPRRICNQQAYLKTTGCTEVTKPEQKGQDVNTRQGERYGRTILCLCKEASLLLDYEVNSKPSAYSSTKRRPKQNVSNETDDCSDSFPLLLENVPSNFGIKQVHNTYTVTCSRQLSSVRNTLLNLAYNKSDEEQCSAARWPATTKQKLDLDIVEIYDTKEDPRGFQKLRDAYRALCFNSSEQRDPLSAEEGQKILRNVSFLKSSLTPGNISDYFHQLSWLPAEQHEAVKADSRFAMLCRYSASSRGTFTLSQLLQLFEAIVRLRVSSPQAFLKFYEAEFCRRVWDMEFSQLLFVADLWRCLGRSVPQYMEIVLSYVALRWKRLTVPQLVQLLYVIGENRRAPPEVMQKLEMLLSSHLEQLNVEEVGAACLGFFKSKNGFSEQLMKRIGDKVAAKMDDISNYSLVNVMKMFRYTHVDHLPFLKRLGEVAHEKIPNVGTQGVMHIVLACASLHYRDKRLLDTVASKVPSKVHYCRSKDVAKYLWSFSTLNFEPENAEEFFCSLTEQLHCKMHEFQRFPEHLLTALLALAFMGRFPYDLIDAALSPQFVKLATEGSPFELKKDLFTLDGTVAIECPDYQGHRLPLNLQQEVTEMLWNFARQDICVKPEVVEAAMLLQVMLGGPQFVKNHMILPHTRSADLEVHFDPTRNPLPLNMEVSDEEVQKLEFKLSGVTITDQLISQLTKCAAGRPILKSEPEPHNVAGGKGVETVKNMLRTEVGVEDRDHTGLNLKVFRNGVPRTNGPVNSLTNSNIPVKKVAVQPKAPSEIQKLAIQVSNRNHYCYSSRILLGLHSMKRRQLVQAGYVVVELPHWEWFPLLRQTRSKKLSYLHQKLYSSLN